MRTQFRFLALVAIVTLLAFVDAGTAFAQVGSVECEEGECGSWFKCTMYNPWNATCACDTPVGYYGCGGATVCFSWSQCICGWEACIGGVEADDEEARTVLLAALTLGDQEFETIEVEPITVTYGGYSPSLPPVNVSREEWLAFRACSSRATLPEAIVTEPGGK